MIPKILQRLRPPLVLAFAALLAVLPLIRNGVSCGHDLSFHLLSWMEAAQQLSHGILHPQWAFTAAWNAGEPRFVFYPPISWYLGALMGLAAQPFVHQPSDVWPLIPIAFTWLALAASGITMYRLCRSFAGPNASLIAAAIYLLNPYMLFTAYERTAYAELLAAAWVPLLLLAALQPRPRALSIAIPVALLWLTNAPAAVMGTYSLAILAVLRIALLWRTHLRQQALPRRILIPSECLSLAGTILGGTALGLGLAAFYIIPAAFERRLVQIDLALVPGLRVQDGFIFHPNGEHFHDSVLSTVSHIAVALLLAIFVVLALIQILKRTLPRRNQSLGSAPTRSLQPHTSLAFTSLATLTLIITFMLLPPSLVIWQHAPELRFLQFSWRLLSIAGAILALASAILLKLLTPRSGSVRTWYGLASIAAVLITAALAAPIAETNLRQACEPDETPAARAAIFHGHTPSPEGSGSISTDEYTPQTADNDAQDHTDPSYWLTDDVNAKPPEDSSPGAAPLHLTLSVPRPEYLVLNLRLYPLWHLSVNGQPTPMTPLREDGLIAIALPRGSTTIDFHLSPSFFDSPDEIAGTILSLLSLIGLLILISQVQRHRGGQSREPRPDRRSKVELPVA